jgi:hypothetical protein
VRGQQAAIIAKKPIINCSQVNPIKLRHQVEFVAASLTPTTKVGALVQELKGKITFPEEVQKIGQQTQRSHMPSMLFAPTSAVVCGLVTALGNRLSAGLPPRSS